MHYTLIRSEQHINGSWTAYVVQDGRVVAVGGAKTQHEAVEAARRAYAIDLAEARREQDEEVALLDE